MCNYGLLQLEKSLLSAEAILFVLEVHFFSAGKKKIIYFAGVKWIINRNSENDCYVLRWMRWRKKIANYYQCSFLHHPVPCLCRTLQLYKNRLRVVFVQGDTSPDHIEKILVCFGNWIQGRNYVFPAGIHRHLQKNLFI